MSETPVDIESLWVEKSSTILYSVKFQDDEYALARALSPALYHLIRRIPIAKFVDSFEEYAGNYDEVRRLLNGDNDILTIGE